MNNNIIFKKYFLFYILLMNIYKCTCGMEIKENRYNSIGIHWASKFIRYATGRP